MNERSAEELRAQAAHCRRLAAATYDKRIQDSLQKSAVEYDDEAAKRDGGEPD